MPSHAYRTSRVYLVETENFNWLIWDLSRNPDKADFIDHNIVLFGQWSARLVGFSAHSGSNSRMWYKNDCSLIYRHTKVKQRSGIQTDALTPLGEQLSDPLTPPCLQNSLRRIASKEWKCLTCKPENAKWFTHYWIQVHSLDGIVWLVWISWVPVTHFVSSTQQALNMKSSYLYNFLQIANWKIPCGQFSFSKDCARKCLKKFWDKTLNEKLNYPLFEIYIWCWVLWYDNGQFWLSYFNNKPCLYGQSGMLLKGQVIYLTCQQITTHVNQLSTLSLTCLFINTIYVTFMINACSTIELHTLNKDTWSAIQPTHEITKINK